MKPFDAKEASIGCEVITRDGKKGTVLHKNGRGFYPVTVLISRKRYDEALNFTNNGKFLLNEESHYDLFFPSKKHGGWVPVWKSVVVGGRYTRILAYRTGMVYDSKEDCEKDYAEDDNFITAAHIEWEE